MGLFTRIEKIEAEDALQLLRERRAVLVDVRQAAEWRAGRVRGAIHVPLPQLHARAATLPQGRTIVTACRSGHRSAAAARMLHRAGFEVVNLRGGLRRWAQLGLPLEPRGARIV